MKRLTAAPPGPATELSGNRDMVGSSPGNARSETHLIHVQAVTIHRSQKRATKVYAKDVNRELNGGCSTQVSLI